MRVQHAPMKFVAETSVTLGADAVSNPICLRHMESATVHIKWTGTPVGTFKLQASCDDLGDGTSGSGYPDATLMTWADISGASVAAGGASGDQMWIDPDAGYLYARVVYTRTSGTGTLTGRVSVKGPQ